MSAAPRIIEREDVRWARERARLAEAAETRSDDELALSWTAAHEDRYRYTGAWAKWYRFDGGRYVHDETGHVFDAIRTHLRHESEGIDKPTARKAVQSAQTIAAVERLARNDRRHAVAAAEWDRDPWALNTPGGLVDLRTGACRATTPRDLLTKQTAVTPGGKCPRWLALLDWATGGDSDMVAYLQRMTGYFLTGDTREHALFYNYGTGGNGKSTTVNTLTGIFADYQRVAGMETFMASALPQHPTDVAGLRGARLVTAQEVQDGRRFDVAKIKALTGGDPIAARFMRGDFFEFTPTFKLWLSGNHKPALGTVDPGIRRRFHLIPFTQRVRDEDRDPALVGRLREEWPGILQWALDGCLAWQAEGLRAPAQVRDATEQYLAAEDSLQTWADEALERDSRAWAPISTLYAAWVRWCEEAGEKPGTSRAFAENMRTHGFESARTKVAKGFSGVRLRDAQGGSHG